MLQWTFTLKLTQSTYPFCLLATHTLLALAALLVNFKSMLVCINLKTG